MTESGGTDSQFKNAGCARSVRAKIWQLIFFVVALVVPNLITTMIWQNVPIGIVNTLVAVVIIVLAVNLWFTEKIEQSQSTNDSSVCQNPKAGGVFSKMFWREHKRAIILGIILVAAVLVRVVAFAVVPAGLNIDEASMLYEAFSLGNYGVDRNGVSFPVYLEACGDGQNVLLTYLTIPFVRVFGMNVFTARIVCLIFALISLFVFYDLVRNLFADQKLVLICFALFALCPYNIMIARWGLESNLFPHFLLYGITFLVKTYHRHPAYLFPAVLCFGVGLYAYAIAYLVIPLLLLGVYIYFMVHGKINRRNLWLLITANLLLFLCALPLILFIMVNHGWLPEIHLGAVTIAKMRAYRGGEIALSNLVQSFFTIGGILLGQNDLLWHNSPLNLGVLYLVTVPFMCWGLVVLLKRLRQRPAPLTTFCCVGGSWSRWASNS